MDADISCILKVRRAPLAVFTLAKFLLFPFISETFCFKQSVLMLSSACILILTEWQETIEYQSVSATTSRFSWNGDCMFYL